MTAVSENWKNGGYAFYPKFRTCCLCNHKTPSVGYRLLSGHLLVCPVCRPHPEPIQGPPRPNASHRITCGYCWTSHPRAELWRPNGYKPGTKWSCFDCNPRPVKERIRPPRPRSGGERLVVEYLSKSGAVTYHQMASALGMSSSGVRKILQLLILEGAVNRRIGANLGRGRGQEPTLFWSANERD